MIAVLVVLSFLGGFVVSTLIISYAMKQSVIDILIVYYVTIKYALFGDKYV